MTWLKVWITTIITLSLFITLAKSMLPNNPVKKYAKYAMGLMIVPVLLTPILKLTDPNEISSKIIEYSKEMNVSNKEVDLKVFNSNEEERVLSLFISNLNKQCEEVLADTYPKKDFKVEVKAFINDNKKIEISNVQVSVSDETVVKQVKDISIDEDSVMSEDKSAIGEKEDIIDFLAKELSISKDKIIIVIV